LNGNLFWFPYFGIAEIIDNNYCLTFHDRFLKRIDPELQYKILRGKTSIKIFSFDQKKLTVDISFSKKRLFQPTDRVLTAAGPGTIVGFKNVPYVQLDKRHPGARPFKIFKKILKNIQFSLKT
jgi:hypothetical protein